jgi:hypothetical protein
VVSSLLPGGSLYTNKVIFPASGFLRVGTQAYVFDPARDFAILDEHKSHLPRHTDWTWGTFAQVADGGYAGANFIARPEVAGHEEESCVWTPTAAEALSDVTFTPQGDDPMSPWKVRSDDGRLDVTFTPEGRKNVTMNMAAVHLDYYQAFGHYDGTLRSAETGKVWPVEANHGVLEVMHAVL